jgi:hypothetical protein
MKASGGPVGEVWAILGAQVRYVRWNLAVRLADRAAAFLRGREARRVKLNTLVPLLEAGSLEEDESMAERWAALLANAANAGEEEVPPSFPEILRQLTPGEARLLDRLIEAPSMDTVAVANEVGIGSQWPVAFDNLVRLRLAVHPFRAGPIAGEDSRQLRITFLGQAFVAACRRPAAPED